MRSLSARLGAPLRRPRDPAPSRWAYRLHRLWLTPLFRAALLRGVPVLAVALVLTHTLADPATLARLRTEAEALRQAIAARPEFAVRELAIEGATEEMAADIAEVLALDFPVSSFDLDLEAMRRAVEDLDAVASAKLRVVAGGRLRVLVAARRPALLWRRADGLELLDAGGRRIMAVADRAGHPDLGLVAGEGADAAVPEALALMRAARPLAARLRGIERIGARRWDVVLTDGQRILLPEAGALSALERAIALDEARNLFAGPVAALDLRDPARTVLRLRPPPEPDDPALPARDHTRPAHKNGEDA